MRRLILSLATAAVIGTALTTALPSPAHAQWGWGQGYYSPDGWDGWRERAWREHRWRELMWRRHLWHEWHEQNGYGEPGGWYR